MSHPLDDDRYIDDADIDWAELIAHDEAIEQKESDYQED